jgi:peptide/nickel transport system substrate-binding protein
MIRGASRLLVGTMTAGGIALVGCSSPPRQHGAAGAGDGQVAVSTGDYRESGVPGRNGGTIRISAAADTGTLDLHAISHTNAQWLGRLIYDNLVYLDEQGNPTPWLANSWTISPDGKTYTFHLRRGVTFSDGAPFDAEAVLVNLEHMRDPKTKSPLAAAYIAPYVSGRVVDRYTFEATLREPYAPFLNVLAQSWLAMMSPKAIREHPETLASKPVGSGPFVVESYVRQQGINLRRRKDYAWAPPYLAHRGPAYVDRIDVAFVPEALIR